MNIEKDIKPIVGLDVKVYNDFIGDLECYERKTINQLLEVKEKYSYFKDQILNNVENIIWNLCLSFCDSDLIDENELNIILKNMAKNWGDIPYNDIMEHIDTFIDARYDKLYETQQNCIKEACAELNLLVVYPEYHGKSHNKSIDKNTVLIYSQSIDKPDKLVCTLINSDCDNEHDIDWFNNGSIDGKSENFKDIIKEYLIEKLNK